MERWMVWWFGKKQKQVNAAQPTAKILRARYDAAQTNIENYRHWAFADAFSADASMSLDVRCKLRERSRYEVANNSYAKGMVLTIANDCIGTGPRLQLQTPDANGNRLVESEFARWADSVNLAEKLRTMRMSKATDGEAFAMLVNNMQVKSPVKLDLQLVEADRVTTPKFAVLNYNFVDGIEFDTYGNPSSYYVLKYHPGDLYFLWEYDQVPASAMIHWFRMDRPSQHRGIPEITPGLPLFAQLRRYTLAVLAAAETAADFAAVLYTDAPANGDQAAIEPMDIVNLEKRRATVLPDGWKLGQIQAQQPVTTYAEFKREILNEIGRCLNIPLNVLLCNSSGYNYASGRLDHQTYYKSIRVEQAHLGEVVLDRIFDAWVYEAQLLTQFAFLRRQQYMPRQWFFDGVDHVDPAKEADAQATRLASNTTTLAAEFARQGKDWEAELRQRAKEQQLMKELGLSTQPVQDQNYVKQVA
jgi:lambda family phage portal protein